MVTFIIRISFRLIQLLIFLAKISVQINRMSVNYSIPLTILTVY